MNHSIRKTAFIAAVALPAALAAQAANADIITDWDYQIDSAFTNYLNDSGGTSGISGTGNNAVFPGGDTTLSWGVPHQNGSGDQSSISITSDVDGSDLITNDPIGISGATFTHDNNIITQDSSYLSSFMLQTQLDLTATAPPIESGTNETVGPITFNSNFIETKNRSNLSNCVQGSVSTCDDIFVLDNAGALGAIGSGQSFTHNGFEYTVFLDINGLGPLTTDQCTDAGASAGCVGFLTQEEQTNEFFSNVRITATEIPAPAVLALFGLGLMGLGFFARRGNA